MFCDVKLCAHSQIRHDYFHLYIFMYGDIFFCGPPLWVEKLAKTCPNVFPKSNICSVMWNFVLAHKSGATIFTRTYLCTGTFFFCVPPLWVEKLAKICPNVFLKEVWLSNIFELCLTYVWARSLRSRCLLRLRPCDCVDLARKSGATIFNRTYLCTGTFFFCVWS